MTSLADRARAIADTARAKAAGTGPVRDYVSREWYVVKRADGQIELFLCPPQGLEWVRALYPGCQVEIRT